MGGKYYWGRGIVANIFSGGFSNILWLFGWQQFFGRENKFSQRTFDDELAK